MNYRLFVLVLAPLQLVATAWAGLPRQAEIEYRYGIMPAALRWSQAAGAYRLELQMAILHRQFTYLSQGQMSRAGLRPESFADFRDRSGAPRYRADFDWQAGTLQLGKPGEQQRAELQSGDQDLLSAAFQLAQQQATEAQFALVNGRKRYAGARFTVFPGETLTLGGRDIPVVRWHGQLEDRSVDYWLASGWSNLPVRMQVNLGEGSFDLVASEIRIDGKTVLQAPAAR
ncbi:DUF3108 domain-containing protein [Chitinilyticum piscinae]|uniref:DUF3108 domain-containing protein n=1 Tax=Chitinilyticum piscinae TaxID=2866724 RepID=A0A8J7G385_9NEIS|nr:DUF3108 domain-containing protein [Chitinilyticum piscinae]MBE9610553.1 DUF3108 domain-containing protein [Chitinilyticum piscinae]